MKLGLLISQNRTPLKLSTLT